MSSFATPVTDIQCRSRTLGGRAYDAFISYSHESVDLADALQTSLQRLSMPWYRRRPFVRVFRDETSFGAGHDLGDKITEALDDSGHLVLLLSPSSVASPWVDHELAHFLATKGPEHVTFVVESWRGDAGQQALGRLNDFDWDGDDVPPSGARPVRRAAGSRHALDRRGDRPDPEERTVPRRVATIAAAIKNQNKDELVGAIVAMRPRARILTGSIALGALILLVAIAVAVPGWLSARSAQQSAEAAVVAAEARLGELDQELATAQLSLDAAETTLRETETQLSDAESDLAAAAANLAAVESDLTSTQAERDQAQADRDAAARERDAAAAARDEAVTERDATAAARDTAVAARDSAVSERDAASAARTLPSRPRHSRQRAQHRGLGTRRRRVGADHGDRRPRRRRERTRPRPRPTCSKPRRNSTTPRPTWPPPSSNLAAVEADLTSTQADRDQARADRDAAAQERDAAAAARDEALKEVDLQVAVGESVRLAVESTRVFDDDIEVAALSALESVRATSSFPAAPAPSASGVGLAAPVATRGEFPEAIPPGAYVTGSSQGAMYAVAASPWRATLGSVSSSRVPARPTIEW